MKNIKWAELRIRALKSMGFTKEETREKVLQELKVRVMFDSETPARTVSNDEVAMPKNENSSSWFNGNYQPIRL